METDDLEINILQASQNQTSSSMSLVHIIYHFLLQASGQPMWSTSCLVLKTAIRPKQGLATQLSISCKARNLQIQRSLRKYVQNFLPLHFSTVSHCFSIKKNQLFFFFQRKDNCIYTIPYPLKYRSFSTIIHSLLIKCKAMVLLYGQILISQNQRFLRYFL